SEMTLYRDQVKLTELIAELHQMKCFFFIDNFGSAYSSLNTLGTLPIDGMKLDQQYLSDITRPGNDKARIIVKAIFSLAKSFDQSTVAEGVESEDQLHYIQSLEYCDQIQGFYFSEPLPATEMEKQLLGKNFYTDNE
ncbi:MAG: EAL domain-containing protein, partial [Lachnospiraceae bacterium]|nr:EAL domain-containing protein [Lachnospiraceae bacterium]